MSDGGRREKMSVLDTRLEAAAAGTGEVRQSNIEQ